MRNLWLKILGVMLASALPGGAAAKPAAQTSAAQGAGPGAALRQIARNVRAVESSAAGYRKVSLWREPAEFMAYRPGGATAYLDARSGALRKVVVVGPTGCVAGNDVREWYFVDGKPVFILQSLSWYRYGTHGILPQIARRRTYRYYLHDGQVLGRAPRAPQEEGEECLDEAAIARESRRLAQALGKVRPPQARRAPRPRASGPRRDPRPSTAGA